jgi:hypothetical protein
MSLFLKEELTVAGHSLVVKERIAEGGFGFVDLVANPQTGQEFVVSILFSPSFPSIFIPPDLYFSLKS